MTLKPPPEISRMQLSSDRNVRKAEKSSMKISSQKRKMGSSGIGIGVGILFT
jgi:hypothetical protein